VLCWPLPFWCVWAKAGAIRVTGRISNNTAADRQAEIMVTSRDVVFIIAEAGGPVTDYSQFLMTCRW
jgi:hypothetical protein